MTIKVYWNDVYRVYEAYDENTYDGAPDSDSRWMGGHIHDAEAALRAAGRLAP